MIHIKEAGMATIFGWWGPVFCHGQSGGLLLRVDYPWCDRLGALYHFVDAVQLRNKTKRFVCLCLVGWGSLLYNLFPNPWDWDV